MARNNKELGILGASKIAVNSILVATAGAAVAVKAGAEAVAFASEGMSRQGAKTLLEDSGWSEDQLAQATSTQITGTSLGKDPDTQITTLITGNVVSLRRQVNENVRLDLNGSDAYTVIFIQDGVSNVVKVNGGSDSVITITQGG